MIRHKATGEFMPQLRRGRGYSHWNPAVKPTPEIFDKHTLVGVPRLLPDLHSAKAVITAWTFNPNAKINISQSYYGEQDEIFDIKPDGRKKEDLEAVEVTITL